MATNPHNAARFELPQRVLSGKKDPVKLDTKIQLIDRMASLPGIDGIVRRDDVIPSAVDLYLKREFLRSSSDNPETALFCRLSYDGIEISGLDRWAKHKVICRGWGRLTCGEVLVYLPRTHRELETAWKIIQRAYDNLFDPSASAVGTNIVPTWEWPRFSRTTLQ